MNYYPFHIGDYAAHTRHLSLMEDLAYRRLLDLYYTRESALPADVTKVARLVGMREQAGEVESVLNEFFIPSDFGWGHSRADAEIDAMQSKQKAQTDKEGHEADRMQRHRDRRAEMFATLRAVGVVPAWDVPMKELQRLVDTACNEPATRTEALQETDLQRLSIPTPTPTPTPIEEKEISPAARVSKSKGERLDAGWELPKAWGDWAQSSYPHWEASAVRVIALGFRNHWVSKTGKDATKLDWYGTWQNWCMSDITQRAHPPPTTSAETNYQRSMRERMEQISPAIAARRPGAPLAQNPMEILDGLTRIAC